MKYVIGTAALGLLIGLTVQYIGGAHVVGWAGLEPSLCFHSLAY